MTKKLSPQNYTIPPHWITLRHAAFVGPKQGQIDVVLARDETTGIPHLLQVVDGKNATIRSGDSAIANFENILAKAPGCIEISTFPWVGQAK